MATELHLHVHLEPDADRRAALARALGAVDASGASRGTWSPLSAREGEHGAELLVDTGERDRTGALAVLDANVANVAPDALHASAATALACTRLFAGSPEPGTVGLSVESLGPRALRFLGRVPFAPLLVRVWDCGPFVATRGAALDPASAERVDTAVRANLETLTSVLVELFDALAPRLALLVTDEAPPRLHDAHLAYFADERAAADAFRAWARAESESPSPPHPRRDAAHARALVEPLRAAREAADALAPADVARVLASGAFDRYDLARGFCVLEYPWFVNAFLDRFVVALGRAAGGGSA